MSLFDQYEATYTSAWSRLAVRPSRLAEANAEAAKALAGKARYQVCELHTGVPWWFHALVHSRENTDDFNAGAFNCYIGNGQGLHRTTTIVPIGRGPFDTFEAGDYDAMKIQGFVGATDWSDERSSFRLEGYNGYGYHAYGVFSPYLGGGTNLYGPPEARGGKYIADHDFSSTTVDTQLGVLAMLKQLMVLDNSIILPPESTEPQPDDILGHGVLWVQHALNTAEHLAPALVEDGRLGPLTMTAVKNYQTKNSLPATGLPDVTTVTDLENAIGTAALVLQRVVVSTMDKCYHHPGD